MNDPIVDDEGNVILEGEGPNPTKPDDKVAALESTVEQMTGIIQTLAAGQTQTQDALTKLAQAIETRNTKPDDDDDDDPLPDDTQLETMSRIELINHIQKNQEKSVQAALKPILAKLNATDSKLDNAITSVTVKDFHADHADLMDWKTEIGSILTENRASAVADAYALARTDNPEKAKTLDAKYDKTVKPDKVKFKGSFEGFPGNTASGGKNQKMTSAQAASAAWDEATSAMPGIDEFLKTSD